ncbi:MAG: Gfo/Idh/MocA family oxidoreductase, partial [Pirellulales bacterium]
MVKHWLEGTTRRDFLKHSGQMAAAATIVSAAAPYVHAAEDNTIRVSLVGCGGRGTGAAEQALSVPNGPIQLVAMADVIPGNVTDSHRRISRRRGKQVEVPQDRQFVGFDGYQKAMDCLRPGDVVILATPPAFRWVHFKYAMDKGLNVFMEKPVAVDVPTSLRMFELAKESVKRNQKVAVGLMCRHCRSRGELFDRIKNSEIGDLTTMRAYRLAGPTGTAAISRQPADEPSELIWQIKNFDRRKAAFEESPSSTEQVR